MATSAIGPGFITQTANFTVQLGAAVAFAIVIPIVVDIAVQLNAWRIIGVSGLKAHELGNRVLPGLGWFIAALVATGGLVLNIGNTAGGGLGLDALLALDPTWGGIITTLVGGTVGGYITYAGAHRIVDAGITGVESVKQISRSSVMSIVLTGVMRFLLFLAILGVVAGGARRTGENLAAQAFRSAAGEVGLRLFGVILWAASISSVIGSAYTSVSFLTTSWTKPRTRNLRTVAFILVPATVFALLGQAPSTLLVVAGAVNGLILPLGFAVLLWVAWRRRDLLGGCEHPTWLALIGTVVWLLTIFLGYQSLSGIAALWA
ncbi:UNVERIFIED_CONTAM: hypothetical protein RF653_16600 [Kocuria sp. CPCC 205316]|uniref:NRAMP family divalent metal transporter n=1 Tax=Kocuria TaxID=57493 RepID=UPI0036DBBAE7